jgi:hypothetical protein
MHVMMLEINTSNTLHRVVFYITPRTRIILFYNRRGFPTMFCLYFVDLGQTFCYIFLHFVSNLYSHGFMLYTTRDVSNKTDSIIK